MTATEFNSRIIPMYGAMRATATRILGNSDDGEDAVQDVLKKLWETRKQLSSDVNLAAYVLRAVKNRCIDHLRCQVIPVSIEDSGMSEQPVEETDEYDRFLRLDKALSSLDDKRREVLKLSLDGMKGDDIAERLSMTPANVRQLLSRARKDLKRMMTEN